jgi:hypothetical protein
MSKRANKKNRKRDRQQFQIPSWDAIYSVLPFFVGKKPGGSDVGRDKEKS